jgi:hypothetical protein
MTSQDQAGDRIHHITWAFGVLVKPIGPNLWLARFEDYPGYRVASESEYHNCRVFGG